MLRGLLSWLSTARGRPHVGAKLLLGKSQPKLLALIYGQLRDNSGASDIGYTLPGPNALLRFDLFRVTIRVGERSLNSSLSLSIQETHLTSVTYA